MKEGPAREGAVALRLGNGPEERRLLAPMLFEAFFWDPAARRPAPAEFETDPEFQKLLAGWGERDGDVAVIAECEGGVVGAAWYRLWTRAEHSYGFIDVATPELAIGVAATHRGAGIGRRLMQALIDEARRARVPALSLSVAPANPALALYESFGFQRVGRQGTSLTLCLRLERVPS